MAFLLETHAHTAENSPCSHLPADELIALIKDAGYDGVVVTDHFPHERMHASSERVYMRLVDVYLEGFRKARDAGEKRGLTVIFGLEIRVAAGPEDYLVYGLEPGALAELHGALVQPIARVKERINALGGLLVQAHPYRPRQSIQPPECLDGVEVFNGNPRHDSRNDLGLAYAVKHGLIQVSGSDVHQTGDVGIGGIVLPAPVKTSAELASVLRGGGYQLRGQRSL